MTLLKSYQIICTSLYKSANTSHLIKRKSHHVYNSFSVTSEDLFLWPPWLLLFFAVTIDSFPDSSVGKESPCNARDPGSIPGSGRSAREGIGYPLQYSWASLLAQQVKNLPAVQETWVRSPGAGKISWRRERLPTSVFWPGEFHELYSPRGFKDLDTTERPSLSQQTRD